MKKYLRYLGTFLVFAISASAQGILFTGTDAEDFAGALPDNLGRFTTVGPVVTGGGLLPIAFHLNGMTHAGGNLLYAGDPLTNTLNTIDFNGNLINSIAAGFPNGVCCNEDMIFDRLNNILYHAHWPDMIQTLDPGTGIVADTFPQTEPVGMTWVGNQIWITHWSAQQVGTWDPLTNLFVPVFNTPDFAGGLAYDPLHGVLWVGERGGFVTPYNTAGLVLGAGFQPFGPLGDTTDGLEFVPMAKIDLKPGSNPNCVNPDSNGNVAVAIFGSEALDVSDLSNITFGGATPTKCSLEDVPMEGPNPGEFPLAGDGIPDLVCHFKTADVDWPAPGTSAPVALTADLAGTPIELIGADTASVIGEGGCPARGPLPLDPVFP